MKKLFLFSALAAFLTSCMTNNTMNDKSAANKAKVQRFYDEIINAHSLATIDSFCVADFTDHSPDPGHTGKGMEDMKASFADFFAGFPDIHMTTNMIIASGDTVMALVTMTGTNSGPMGGQPATNKQISIMGTDILILKDGKATDRWGYFENMKMMQQLGMMPAPGVGPDSSTMAKK